MVVHLESWAGISGWLGLVIHADQQLGENSSGSGGCRTRHQKHQSDQNEHLGSDWFAALVVGWGRRGSQTKRAWPLLDTSAHDGHNGMPSKLLPEVTQCKGKAGGGCRGGLEPFRFKTFGSEHSEADIMAVLPGWPIAGVSTAG